MNSAALDGGLCKPATHLLVQGQLLVVVAALLVLGKVAGVVRWQVQQRFHPSAAAVVEQQQDNHASMCRALPL